MTIDKSLLEETTGYVGIGSLELLGVLALFDAKTGFYDLVKAYMATSALFAIPCLALAYLLGLSTVVLWSQMRDGKSPLSPELLSKLSEARLDQLVARFCEAERQAKLLGGSTIAVAILALGLLMETKHAEPFEAVAIGSAGLLLAIAIACGILSRRVQERAAWFIQRAVQSNEGPTTF